MILAAYLKGDRKESARFTIEVEIMQDSGHELSEDEWSVVGWNSNPIK